jgi:hypothetical protein
LISENPNKNARSETLPKSFPLLIVTGPGARHVRDSVGGARCGCRRGVRQSLRRLGWCGYVYQCFVLTTFRKCNSNRIWLFDLFYVSRESRIMRKVVSLHVLIDPRCLLSGMWHVAPLAASGDEYGIIERSPVYDDLIRPALAPQESSSSSTATYSSSSLESSGDQACVGRGNHTNTNCHECFNHCACLPHATKTVWLRVLASFSLCIKTQSI